MAGRRLKVCAADEDRAFRKAHTEAEAAVDQVREAFRRAGGL